MYFYVPFHFFKLFFNFPFVAKAAFCKSRASRGTPRGGKMSHLFFSNKTVIAMLTASHFLENTISIPQQLQDLKVLIPIYSHLIFKGNHIYSSFNVPAQQPNLDVKDVLHYNHDSFQKIKLIADVGIFTTEDLKNYILPTAKSKICCGLDCTTRQDNGPMLSPNKHLPL